VLAWQPAYVGIGSNLGDSRERLQQAFEALGSLPQTRLVCRSPLYANDDMFCPSIDHFIKPSPGSFECCQIQIAK